MRPFERTWLLLCLVGAMTSAISAAVLAHLPHGVVLRIENETQQLSTRQLSTFDATVRDVLNEAKIAVGPHDRLIPDPSTRLAPGLTIEVRRAFPVTLQVDGGERKVMTGASTVDELIGDHRSGVQVRPRDRVYPAPETPLSPGAVVRIVRIETRIVSKPERLPYARVSKPDTTLPRGMTRLAQAGRAGVRTRRIAVTTADGAVIDRQVLGTVMITPPQDQVLQVGTRRVFAARGEFAGKEIVQMEATAYAPWTGKGVDDITAIGLKARYGVVAVDPRVIPLRSELFIEGYGRAIAGDTGGAIKGHRIDLCYNTAREAIKFGRRPVRVYILSTPPPRKR